MEITQIIIDGKEAVEVTIDGGVLFCKTEQSNAAEHIEENN